MRHIKKLLGPKSLLLLSVAYTIVVTIAFLMPGKEIPPTTLPLDKVVHVSIHAVLILVWLLYVSNIRDHSIPKKTLLWIAAGCLLYGIIIEVVQERYIPLRHADVWDLLANFIGILLGIVLFYRTRKYFGNQI